MFKRLAFVLLVALVLNVVLAEKAKEHPKSKGAKPKSPVKEDAKKQGNRGFGHRPNQGQFGSNYPYGQNPFKQIPQPTINPRTYAPMALPNQQCSDSNSCPWGYECTGLCTRQNNIDDTGSCFNDRTCQAGYVCKDGTNCRLIDWNQVGRCRDDRKCTGGYACNLSNRFCYRI